MKLKNIISIALLVTCFSSTGFARTESKVESSKDKQSVIIPAAKLFVFAGLASWFYSLATSAERPLLALVPKVDPKTVYPDLSWAQAFWKVLPIQLKVLNSKGLVLATSFFGVLGFNKAFSNTNVTCDDANAIITATANRSKKKKAKADEQTQAAIEAVADAGSEGGCGCC